MRLSRHILAACAVLCVLAVPAFAGGQPPAPPSGSIAGTIRSAADDTPLARARVVATTQVSQVPFVAITGADGGYVLRNLPPGGYTLTASHTGFVTESYARRRAAPAGRVQLADGQNVTSMDIALSPAGAITGRILDEDGAPFAGAAVAALQSRFENGQHVLAQVARATSDDRGEFRLFGLEPGQYYVSAADPAFDNVGSARGAIRYAPTYYPGTSIADDAKAVMAATDGHPPRVEFKLRLVPPAWVSGHLVAFDRRSLLSAAVVMTPLDSDGSPVVAPESVTLQPDGRFTFAAIPPGRYVIRARGQTQASGFALFSHFNVVVGGDDVGNIELTLRPGALLEGTVVFESTSSTRPPAVSSIRVRAPLTDGSGFGDALTGSLARDRRYAIRGLMDGEHQIVVEGLADPWVVKSVMLRGANITDEVIDAREGQHLIGVRITLTDHASEVTGTVKTAKDAPAVDAAVLVFSVAPQFWLRTNRRMRLARTNADGRFTIYGLPPGNYLAVSSYMFDEGDVGRKKLLEGLRATATPFTVSGDLARPSIDLHLLSAVPAGSIR